MMHLTLKLLLHSPAPLSLRPLARTFRRYYIGSDKLATLGWVERTSWEDGLKRTIDWYLGTKISEYWIGDVEGALQPHPMVPVSATTLNSPHIVL